jgi:hypothetical protein
MAMTHALSLTFRGGRYILMLWSIPLEGSLTEFALGGR